MNKAHLLITLTFLVTLFTPDKVLACRVAKTPAWHPIEEYSEIYIAEVVGVHLTEREKQLEKYVAEGQPDVIEVSAAAADHTVYLVLLENLKGTTSSKTTVSISGCAIRVPALSDRGIFFITNTGDVFPVYKSNIEQYEYWVELAKSKLVARR